VAAVEAALRYFGWPELGFRLEVSSPLPRGKGMGSSTADVAGAIYAVARALGREISSQNAARLCLAIEPTNSSLFPNIALFDHRAGSLFQELGPPPAMGILALDFGGEVDTLSYNAVDRSALLKELEPQAIEALELVKLGLARGDASLMGRGATLSARAHQRVLYKPQLEAVIAIAEEVEALGVSVGHSGTIIGVLLDPACHRRGLAAHLRSKLEGLQHIYPRRLIGGGYREPGEAVREGIFVAAQERRGA
jgi:L-threonine kinase